MKGEVLLDNSTITYKVSFYKLFTLQMASLVAGILLGILIVLFTGKVVNWTLIILFIPGIMIFGTIFCIIISALFVKYLDVQISDSGISLQRLFLPRKVVEWESISNVKYVSIPLIKHLVIFDKNKKKFSTPLYLDQIEQFRLDIIRLAGDENPVTQVIKDLSLSNPPKFRKASSKRSGLKKRLAISIAVGVVFLFFVGVIFINAWIFVAELNEQILTQGIVCSYISELVLLQICLLGPIVLIITAFAPSLLIVFDFKKRVIVASVILIILGSIAFFIMGPFIFYTSC